jgi:hypothetical protein
MEEEQQTVRRRPIQNEKMIMLMQHENLSKRERVGRIGAHLGTCSDDLQ